MNLREQFEKETGQEAEWYYEDTHHLFTHEYVEWLEQRNKKQVEVLKDAHGTFESLTYSGEDKFVVEDAMKNIEELF